MSIRLLSACLAAVLAGCAAEGPAAPQATDPGLPPAASGAPTAGPPAPDDAPRMTKATLVRSGTILLRAASNPVYEGDDPSFHLHLPPGVRALTAHAEWSPPQAVGLELQAPDGSGVRSWDLVNARVLPPIDLAVPEPVQGGTWFVYLGPDTVGGLVTWSLTIEAEVPEDLVEEFRAAP